MVHLNFAHRASLGPSASTYEGKPSRGGDQPVAKATVSVCIAATEAFGYDIDTLMRRAETKKRSARDADRFKPKHYAKTLD